MIKQGEKKPLVTLKDVVLGGLVVIFFAFAFEKPEFLFERTLHTPTRNISLVEVKHFASDGLVAISADEIKAQLEKKDGKATLMLIYASWCSYCKKLIPDILSLKKEGKIDNFLLLFLSVDRDREELAKYLLQHDYDKLLTPYILEKDGNYALENMIMKKGHLYSGGLPYTVIFDDDGNVSSAIRGLISKGALLGRLEQVVFTK